MPVIVISGSRSDDDLARAYENQVAAYVLKPGSRDEYFNAMRALKEFFFHVSTQTQPTPTTTMTARNWPARVTPGSDSLKRWHIKLRSAARAEAIVFQLEDGRGAAWRRGLTGVDIAKNLIKRAQVTNATREIDSGRLCRWPDILIYSEEITGIILGFDRGQPIVIPAIRRPNPVLAFFHHAGPRLPLASVLLLALLAPGRVLGR